MVAVPKAPRYHTDPDALEKLEEIICGLSACLRALLDLSRQGTLVNLIEGGFRMSNTAQSESNPNAPARYSAFVVENFEGADGAEKSHWTKVGAAFPHKDGRGFSIELAAIPVNGKLVIRAQDTTA